MAKYKFGIDEPPHRRWPIAWYNPAVLFRSAREMVASGDLIRNFDRRELFTAAFDAVDLSQTSTESADSNSTDYWWDFMSDSGDGGSASYTVARAMQTPILRVGASNKINPAEEDSSEVPSDNLITAELGVVPNNFPAGKLLILGGDLAYPGANTEEYQYRFLEMWEAARPDINALPPTVASIPQNHDWFDNISSFNRHFIGDYKNHFLKAYTPQTRSYFAIKLPHNWWLFGLDFALVADLDRAQYEAFRTVMKNKMVAGDNVILIYPEPYWTRPLGDDARPGYPKRYQRLEAKLMEYGIKVRIRLAGDLHHYVRETAVEGAGLDYEDLLITCGAGGAFLHPTHAQRVAETKVMDRACDSSAMTQDLENRVCVGIHDIKSSLKNEPATQENKNGDDSDCSEDKRIYTSKVCYPDQDTSKCLSYWNVFALFKPAAISGLFAETASGTILQRVMQRIGEVVTSITAGNIMFPILLGFLYLLAIYCNSFVFSKSFIADGFIPASLINTVSLPDFLVLWLKALFYSPLALGVHIVLLILCGSIAHEDGWKTGLFGSIYGTLHIFAAATLFWGASFITSDPFLKGLIIVPGGIICGGLIFGCYFTLMARLGYLCNNSFSALGHNGYKGFIRFRIDKDGNLHGYMLGTDTVPSRWTINKKAKRPLWIEKNEKNVPEWKVRDVFTLRK